MTVTSYLPRSPHPVYPPVTQSESPIALSQAPTAAATPLAGETPQAKGDGELKNEIIKSLIQYQSSSTPKPVQSIDVTNIPSRSSYGQQLALHDGIVNSKAFKQWKIDNQLDQADTLTIDTQKGTITGITYGKNYQVKTVDLHTFAGWPLLLSATKALMPEEGRLTLSCAGDAKTTTATKLHNIARFYGIEFPSLEEYLKEGPGAQLKAVRLLTSKLSTETITPANASDPFKEDLSHQKTQLADLNNRFRMSTALASLPHTTRRSSANDIYEDMVASRVYVEPESSYAPKVNQPYTPQVDLVSLMEGYGITPPKSYEEVDTLTKALQSPPLRTPAHGNLAGALTHLSIEDQRVFHQVIKEALSPEEETSLLDQLTRGIEWDEKAFSDSPRLAIDAMLKSPFAQKLAKAAEERLGKLASPDAISDWALEAIHTVLGPHEDLEKYTTPKTLGLATFIMSSRKSPESLVKNKPEFLTKGTHSGVSFATAFARTEAQAPGATSNMTYAEIMKRADLPPVTLADRMIEQQAQNTALKDWGVINGVLVANDQGEYTESQMEQVRDSFSQQVSELNAASETFSKEIPDLHKRAVDAIKKWNPHLTEEQILSKSLDATDPELLAFPGPYSLVDVFLQKTDRYDTYRRDKFTSREPSIDLDTVVIHADQASVMKGSFNTDIKSYSEEHESATRAQTKYLISNLSLDDRRIIENGKITVSREVQVSTNNFGASNVKRVSHSSVIVRSEVQEEGRTRVYSYEIDGATNTVRKRDDLKDITPGSLPGEFPTGLTSTYLESIIPDGDYTTGLLDQHPSGASDGVPNSYFSERSKYIADAMVKSVDIKGYEDYLRGQTTFDTEVPFYQKIVDFLKGLIPGYNAVENFVAGKWQEGLVDLAWDAFGFLLAGATATVKAGASAAGGASNTLLKGGKKLARGAIGALNPLDPQGLGLAGVQEVIKTVQRPGVAGSKSLPFSGFKFDVANTFKNVSHATIGTADRGGEKQEVAATQWNGNWYALDPVTYKPYGLPLKDFAASS
jgi:hypothetical protein